MELPTKGRAREELLIDLAAYREQDVDWRGGRAFGYMYDGGREVERFAKEVYAEFLSENALDPTVFPSLRRFEVEVVDAARRHLRGGEQVVGTFTSGGTESCMLAVKTARDWARVHQPKIRAPQMILPITVHAAFHKAAEYFGVEVVRVGVDADFRAKAAEVERAVNENTILIVGSAASFAHGVIDPIAEMAAIASRQGVLMHVDGCIGGWVLGYLRRLGRPIPDFDFTVPGVTSVSMDLHKYAYCAKGASLLMWRDKTLRRHQIFGCAEWTGYSMVNTTMQSTKSGGPVAAAWATLQFIGDDGYLDRARRAMEATDKIVAGIEAIDGLRMMAKPDMPVIAFTSDVVDVFHLADELKERGWLVGAQLAYGPSKENIHLTITQAHLDVVDELLRDIRAAADASRGKGPPPIALQLAPLVTQDIGEDALGQMLAMAGISGTVLPPRMAEINHVLNVLPPKLKERLLIEYLNDLFTA